MIKNKYTLKIYALKIRVDFSNMHEKLKSLNEKNNVYTALNVQFLFFLWKLMIGFKIKNTLIV